MYASLDHVCTTLGAQYRPGYPHIAISINYVGTRKDKHTTLLHFSPCLALHNHKQPPTAIMTRFQDLVWFPLIVLLAAGAAEAADDPPRSLAKRMGYTGCYRFDPLSVFCRFVPPTNVRHSHYVKCPGGHSCCPEGLSCFSDGTCGRLSDMTCTPSLGESVCGRCTSMPLRDTFADV